MVFRWDLDDFIWLRWTQETLLDHRFESIEQIQDESKKDYLDSFSNSKNVDISVLFRIGITLMQKIFFLLE